MGALFRESLQGAQSTVQCLWHPLWGDLCFIVFLSLVKEMETKDERGLTRAAVPYLV